MKLNKIEKSLNQALDSVPAIPFKELAAQPYVKMSEHDYITRQETKRNTVPVRRLAFAAIMCIILLLPATGWFYQNRVPDSVILLDVNPSLKIVTNHKGEVLSVYALNEDAKGLLQGNDYKDISLTETVSVILDSMVEQSYLSTEKNTILLTVMNRNKQKADELRLELGTTILENLKTKDIIPVIMSQTISRQTKRSELAKQYQVSEGKMKLIEEIIIADDSYSMEELAGKSMEQLLQIAGKLSMDLGSYNITGNNENTSGASQNNTGNSEAYDINDSISDVNEMNSQDEDSYEDGESGQQDRDDADEDDDNGNDSDEDNAGKADSDEEDDNKSDYQKNQNRQNEDQSGKDSKYQDSTEEDQQGDYDGNEDGSDNSGNEENDVTDSGNSDESEDTGEGDQGDSGAIRENDDTGQEENAGEDNQKEGNQEGDSQDENLLDDNQSEAARLDNNTEDTQGTALEQSSGTVSED